MSMTLEEAIEHAEEVAEENEKEFGLCPYPSQECNGTQDCRCLENGEGKGCLKCAKEHRQLAKWLKELAERRKQPEIVYCKDCKHYKIDHPRANGYHCCYRCHNIFPMKEDDFCSRAEKRYVENG